MQDLLAAAAAARTMSIKLGGIEYANELSAKLKDHANLLETKYQSLTQLVKDKSPEKILKTFVEGCVEDLTFGSKAQACKPVWCKGGLRKPATCFTLRSKSVFNSLDIFSPLLKVLSLDTFRFSTNKPSSFGRCRQIFQKTHHQLKDSTSLLRYMPAQWPGCCSSSTEAPAKEK